MFVFFRDENVEEFLNSIMKELPCIASIDEIELKDEHINGYEDFEIIISSEGEKTSVTPVDTAICEECVRIASLNIQILWTEGFMHKLLLATIAVLKFFCQMEKKSSLKELKL